MESTEQSVENLVRSPLRDRTNVITPVEENQPTIKNGGDVDSFIDGKAPSPEPKENIYAIPGDQLSSHNTPIHDKNLNDTDDSTDYESAGEGDYTQNALGLTHLAATLENIHISTPKEIDSKAVRSLKEVFTYEGHTLMEQSFSDVDLVEEDLNCEDNVSSTKNKKKPILLEENSPKNKMSSQNLSSPYRNDLACAQASPLQASSPQRSLTLVALEDLAFIGNEVSFSPLSLKEENISKQSASPTNNENVVSGSAVENKNVDCDPSLPIESSSNESSIREIPKPIENLESMSQISPLRSSPMQPSTPSQNKNEDSESSPGSLNDKSNESDPLKDNVDFVSSNYGKLETLSLGENNLSKQITSPAKNENEVSGAAVENKNVDCDSSFSIERSSNESTKTKSPQKPTENVESMSQMSPLRSFPMQSLTPSENTSEETESSPGKVNSSNHESDPLKDNVDCVSSNCVKLETLSLEENNSSPAKSENVVSGAAVETENVDCDSSFSIGRSSNESTRTKSPQKPIENMESMSQMSPLRSFPMQSLTLSENTNKKTESSPGALNDKSNESDPLIDNVDSIRSNCVKTGTLEVENLSKQSTSPAKNENVVSGAAAENKNVDCDSYLSIESFSNKCTRTKSPQKPIENVESMSHISPLRSFPRQSLTPSENTNEETESSPGKVDSPNHGSDPLKDNVDYVSSNCGKLETLSLEENDLSKQITSPAKNKNVVSGPAAENRNVDCDSSFSILRSSNESTGTKSPHKTVENLEPTSQMSPLRSSPVQPLTPSKNTNKDSESFREKHYSPNHESDPLNDNVDSITSSCKKLETLSLEENNLSKQITPPAKNENVVSGAAVETKNVDCDSSIPIGGSSNESTKMKSPQKTIENVESMSHISPSKNFAVQPSTPFENTNKDSESSPDNSAKEASDPLKDNIDLISSNCEKIETLSLEEKNVNSIHSSWKKIQNLTLERENVESIPSICEKIQTLSLEEENVDSIHASCKKIQTLSLEGENVESIPSSCEKIQTLVLEGEIVESNPSTGGNIQTLVLGGEIVESNPSSGGNIQTLVLGGETVESNPSSGGIIQTLVLGGETVESNPSSGGIIQTLVLGGETVESKPSSGGIIQTLSLEGENVESIPSSCEKIQTLVLEGEMAESNPSTGGNIQTLVLGGEIVESNPSSGGNIQTLVLGGETVEWNPSSGGIIQTLVLGGETVESNPSSGGIIQTLVLGGETVESNPSSGGIIQTLVLGGETVESKPSSGGIIQTLVLGGETVESKPSSCKKSPTLSLEGDNVDSIYSICKKTETLSLDVEDLSKQSTPQAKHENVVSGTAVETKNVDCDSSLSIESSSNESTRREIPKPIEHLESISRRSPLRISPMQPLTPIENKNKESESSLENHNSPNHESDPLKDNVDSIHSICKKTETLSLDEDLSKQNTPQAKHENVVSGTVVETKKVDCGSSMSIESSSNESTRREIPKPIENVESMSQMSPLRSSPMQPLTPIENTNKDSVSFLEKHNLPNHESDPLKDNVDCISSSCKKIETSLDEEKLSKQFTYQIKHEYVLSVAALENKNVDLDSSLPILTSYITSTKTKSRPESIENVESKSQISPLRRAPIQHLTPIENTDKDSKSPPEKDDSHNDESDPLKDNVDCITPNSGNIETLSKIDLSWNESAANNSNPSNETAVDSNQTKSAKKSLVHSMDTLQNENPPKRLKFTDIDIINPTSNLDQGKAFNFEMSMMENLQSPNEAKPSILDDTVKFGNLDSPLLRAPSNHLQSSTTELSQLSNTGPSKLNDSEIKYTFGQGDKVLHNTNISENSSLPGALDITVSEFEPILNSQENVNETENFESGTEFDFDYFYNKSGDKSKTNLTRQSLFIKFDPLVERMVNEETMVESTELSEQSGMLENTVVDQNGTPEKPADILIPITPIPNKRNEPTPEKTPATKAKRNSLTINQEVLFKEIANLKELIIEQETSHHKLLTDKTAENEQLRNTIAELERIEESKHDVLKELEEKDVEIAMLIKELHETKFSSKELVIIIEEYEKTIEQLVSAREQMEKEHESEKELLIKERDTAVSHLNNMEIAFNDIHQKYERVKGLVETLHQNEKILKDSLDENAVTIGKLKSNYDKLKNHASEKLQAANNEITTLSRDHQTEIAKMKAGTRKTELKLKSVEEALEQKQKEVRELTQICDELIGKVSK